MAQPPAPANRPRGPDPRQQSAVKPIPVVPVANVSGSTVVQPAMNSGPRTAPAPSRPIPVASTTSSIRDEYDELAAAFRPRWTETLPSWLCSMLAHMLLLIVMALWTIPGHYRDHLSTLLASFINDDSRELGDDALLLDETPELKLQPVDQFESLQSVAAASSADISQVFEQQVASALPPVSLREFGVQSAPLGDLLGEVREALGNGLEGRGEGMKQALIARFGGTEASEAAVARGLEWLAAHQRSDGSWDFDHRDGPCNGRCRDPGEFAQAQIGATGMALLPFLGAGVTQRDGKYKKNVQAGLTYLIKHSRATANGRPLIDRGQSYSHGIATMALCEAYALTKDKELQPPAQQALDYITFAQDPIGGGWRYVPKQPGDTSVLGWLFMALHSGRMGYLAVPVRTIRGVHHFLDNDLIQFDSGSGYNYQEPGKEENPATTAIGLLCRMYLGWEHDNPALQRGVLRLSELGPSKTNIYYNYYATQVMHHFEGDQWKQWNEVMREQLIKTQDLEDHERGSWQFARGPVWPPSGTREGGRLYCTAMSLMILEVYYRHMPLYQKQAVAQDF